MTNRLGPEVRGVAARPSPLAATANDTWFNDCVGGDPTTGTMFEQSFFNNLLGAMRDTFTAAGPGLPVNDSIWTRAIQMIIQGGGMNFAADTGNSESKVIALNPAPLALTNGMRIWFMNTNAPNVGTAPTLNLNGYGAWTITSRDGLPLSPGDLVASSFLEVQLIMGSPNRWRLLSPQLEDILVRAPYINRVVYFTANGTFTAPISGSCEVICIGGGGAGGASGWTTAGGALTGNSGAGGGGGGFCLKRIVGLTPGAGYAIAVGGGGVGVANGYGTGGGTSSFSGQCSATGGLGGGDGSLTIGGQGGGGYGSGGDMNLYGAYGGFSGPNSFTPTASDIESIYNKGGLAIGGWGVPQMCGTGGAGLGFGSGGAGASGGVGLAGGAGAPGIVVVRF
jgi:hypothetical protein